MNHNNKTHYTGLLVMSIGGLMGIFSFELGRYIHSLGSLGLFLSSILMLIGTVLHFKK